METSNLRVSKSWCFTSATLFDARGRRPPRPERFTCRPTGHRQGAGAEARCECRSRWRQEFACGVAPDQCASRRPGHSVILIPIATARVGCNDLWSWPAGSRSMTRR